MKNSKTTTSLFNNALISFILSTMFFLSTGSSVFSQDDKNIEGIVSNFVLTGEQTLQPYADAVSADMNSGLFHSAKVNSGFNLYFGIKGTGTYINGDNTTVINANKTLSIMPMAVPQLNIGSVWGTEMSVRYLPQITIGKYGAVGMFGVSIKHGITSHFKNSPIDAAIQFSYNTLKINDSKGNDMMTASSFATGLMFSKELSVFTIYTGAQYESTSINANVSYNGIDSKMSFNNQNKFRGVIGLNIKLGPLNLNGDYSVGKTNSISAGFGFAF